MSETYRQLRMQTIQRLKRFAALDDFAASNDADQGLKNAFEARAAITSLLVEILEKSNATNSQDAIKDIAHAVRYNCAAPGEYRMHGPPAERLLPRKNTRKKQHATQHATMNNTLEMPTGYQVDISENPLDDD